MVRYHSEEILNTGEKIDNSLIDTMNEIAKDGCRYFLIDAGMSTGKTYLMIKEFALKADAIDKRVKVQYEWTDTLNRRILILTNRVALTTQIIQQYGIDSGNMIIDVRSYQDIERRIIENADLSMYSVIVADEAHYFFSDSGFSKYTEVSLKYLLEEETINRVVFMTATPSVLISYIDTYYRDIEVVAFKIKKEIGIRCLYYYRNELTEDILTGIHQDNLGKFILFRNNKENNRELQKQLEKRGIVSYVMDTESKDKKSEELRSITFEQKLPKDAEGLITTSVIDNGINIYDPEVKTIIIEDYLDIVSAVQCIGRKRISEEAEKQIDLYVKIPNNKKLENGIRRCKANIEKANQYTSNPRQLFEEIGRENLSYEVFYLDLEGIAKLNDVALHKMKHDYKFIDNCLKDADYYIAELEKLLGYNIHKKEDLEDLKITLVCNELTQALKPFLSIEEKEIKMFRASDCDYSREKLIAVINQYLQEKEKLKDDCRVGTVNKLFKKYSISYVIESHKELSKQNRNKNYWVLKMLQ